MISTIEQLEPRIFDAVKVAIRDGAEIDAIVEKIQSLSGQASRSAVGRYSKKARDLTERQREYDRFAEIWVRELGERPRSKLSHLVYETLRTLSLQSAIALGEGAEPADPKELVALARANHYIENTGRLNDDHERALISETLRQATERVDEETRKHRHRGLSKDAVAAIRAAIERGEGEP